MKLTCSNKPLVQQIIKSCYKFGVRHVVISPGSRNAPLTISFTNNSIFTCYSIPDERSAAFYALGMAKKLNEPVAIVCTSGSAVLNYAPAIAEAYYQEIPLIVITADRPPEWIDQEDGQTIRQNNIYNNYISYSVSLSKGNTKEELVKAKQDIEKAYSIAINKPQGPVHINIPFDEPLYETETIDISEERFTPEDENKNESFDELIQAWNNAEKVMILAGVMQVDDNLNSIISDLIEKKNALVVAPSYSNLQHPKIISIPELIFNTLTKNAREQLKPDLLISIGGSMVSKATKLFLREYKPNRHFDIDFNKREINTYLSLTDKLISSHSKALSYVNKKGTKKPKGYLNQFLQIQEEKLNKSEKVISKYQKSDVQVFQTIFKNINQKVDMHFSNSTPIRYSELFCKNKFINYYSNRGTSGIDGNTSIAAGAALVSKKQTILITGDISFGYDSNAFWNKHVPSNLKIIVINNGGGNIFRIINGPEKSGSIDYFETSVQKSIELFCSTHNVDYLKCDTTNIASKFEELINKDKCTVLEIYTDAKKSAESYKDLFRNLRK